MILKSHQDKNIKIKSKRNATIRKNKAIIDKNNLLEEINNLIDNNAFEGTLFDNPRKKPIISDFKQFKNIMLKTSLKIQTLKNILCLKDYNF